ncbi:MAG: protein kinase [Gammaproteobacteria bacterium]|nr:protein kinase [Gammaproteobacteria bacterium]MBU1776276.1 protein kinase [Gammaproteobacteria bacterium]MBU1967999.1 protein kinase [Gammaproteobacteria bacterium]
MKIPDTLGKYSITKKLGQGATSTVYLGFDPFAKREVAVKLLKQEILNDPKMGKLYQRQLDNEASLAGKLSHPHIVAIYDALIGDDASYVVMEYVSGGTLEKHAVPDNLLPIDKVVEYIFKCCRALNYAQFNGVIHRDIKPANMLLTQDGDIKISDMGAALLLDIEQTQVNNIGSPGYMSPEQIRAEVLTHQTDIYSLGVVMYRLLTGHAPFHAQNLASLCQLILHSEAPPMRSLRADIPPQLEQIVAKAMHKDRKERYQNWKDFGADLAALGRFEQRDIEINQTEKFTSLREMTLFKDFTDVELWEILRVGEWQKQPAGTVLMREDEMGDAFYIIIDGSVSVTKNGRLLNVIRGDDCFGEMAYISGRIVARSATVTAGTEVTVLKISPKLLSQLSDHCQLHFNQAFLRVMADRLRMADDRFAKLAN